MVPLTLAIPMTHSVEDGNSNLVDNSKIGCCSIEVFHAW